MSSLRERMLRLRGGSSGSAGDGAERPEEAKPEEPSDADRLGAEWGGMGVYLARSAEGEFLIRRSVYPLTHRHGVHGLSELGPSSGALAAFERLNALANGRNRSGEVKPEKLLFLDLETTGLGVGAGNVPFMVGLAYAEEDRFVVEQMLIRHPAEERAMLSYLTGKLPAYTHLVTYNGKTFDWPVMANRFILNGFRSFAWNPVHIDLLHPSRSVWRNTLASCRLSHVEEERLGIERRDDVPGSMAPAIYFQYLADGDPGPLLGVFVHNETDMLSLACLAIRFGRLLGGGLGEALPYPEEAEELVRTGLWLEKMGESEYAEPLYARIAEDPAVPSHCLRMVAERDKKCGNWRRAVLLWQKAVHASESAAWPDWQAHIELAMYHEHKTKRYDLALEMSEAALELAQRRYAGLRLDAKRRTELESIRKRIDRLRLKAARRYG